jgi:hypothetical protein
MEHFEMLIGSLNRIRPHPRIVNKLAGGNQYDVIIENCSPSTARRGGCHCALSGPFTTKMPAAMLSSHSQLTVNFNRRILDGIANMKNGASLKVLKTTVQYRLERG